MHINSMLASLNSLFAFLGWVDLKVKSIKLQRQIYCPEETELTKAEYVRLINTAKQKGNERLNLLIQTICGTGIRVSELQYITVEAVKCGEAVVSLKGKTRTVFIVKELKQKLLRYGITQVTNAKGGIDRNYYDESGRQTKQITNHDHGRPKQHNYGKHGEHAHDYTYNENGDLTGRPSRELTEKERKENSDIL